AAKTALPKGQLLAGQRAQSAVSLPPINSKSRLKQWWWCLSSLVQCHPPFSCERRPKTHRAHQPQYFAFQVLPSPPKTPLQSALSTFHCTTSAPSTAPQREPRLSQQIPPRSPEPAVHRR